MLTSRIRRGMLMAIELERSATGPDNAVCRVPAGCSPVCVAGSPEGERVYVAARGRHAQYASVPVGIAVNADHVFVACDNFESKRVELIDLERMAWLWGGAGK